MFKISFTLLHATTHWQFQRQACHYHRGFILVLFVVLFWWFLHINIAKVTFLLQWEPKASRMLKLQLTDGVQIVEAMEHKPIPGLRTTTPPGTKVWFITASVAQIKGCQGGK
jgi:hypothetical protein